MAVRVLPQELATQIEIRLTLPVLRVPLQELATQIEIRPTLQARRALLPELHTPIGICLTLQVLRVPLQELQRRIVIHQHTPEHRARQPELQRRIATLPTTPGHKEPQWVTRRVFPMLHRRHAMALPLQFAETSTTMACMEPAGTRIIPAHGQPLAGVQMTPGVRPPGILQEPGVVTILQLPFTTTMAIT